MINIEKVLDTILYLKYFMAERKRDVEEEKYQII